MGMSHRGRLNVMVNTIGKSPAEIFSKFEDVDPRSILGGGDVKYHVGRDRRSSRRAMGRRSASTSSRIRAILRPSIRSRWAAAAPSRIASARMAGMPFCR